MIYKFDIQFFAHKKGQGSSTNGRDSNPKYRGIKVYAGQEHERSRFAAASRQLQGFARRMTVASSLLVPITQVMAAVAVSLVIALALSNGLVGMSGALICQSQKYADIGMGTGAIVIGLAAIVIGEVLGRLTPGKLTAFGSRLVSVVVGSVVYFIVRAVVLQMGLDANDMKLLSAAIVALALATPVVLERHQLRRSYKRDNAASALPDDTAKGGER